MAAYCAFNIALFFFLFWAARMPHHWFKKKSTSAAAKPVHKAEKAAERAKEKLSVDDVELAAATPAPRAADSAVQQV